MPRSKEEFERIRLASRKKILEVAQQLFSSKGYKNTSIQKIATGAGMAKSTVYHHFKTKEDILVTLLDDFYQTWSDTVHFTADYDNPFEHLSKVIHSSVLHIKKNKEAYIMLEKMGQIVMNDPKMLQRLQKISEEKTTTFTKIFTRMGIEDIIGELHFFNSTFRGATQMYLVMGENFPYKKVINMLLSRYKNIN